MLSWRRADLEALPARLVEAGFEVGESSIAAPVSAPAQIDTIDVPEDLAHLWDSEAGAVEIYYSIDARDLGTTEFTELVGTSRIYGGPALLYPATAARARSAALEWADAVVGGDIPESSRHFWLESVPFAAMRNGDYLAFNGRGKVVYLVHDGESFVLSETVAAFLRDWATLGFVGPEWWMLEPFSDDDGRLRADQEPARSFAAAFVGVLSG